MANIPEINIPAEAVLQVGPVVINNAIIGTLLTSVIILVFAFLVRRKAGVIPSRWQVVFEFIYDFLWAKMVMTFGSEKRARKFLPLLMTIFLILIVANQFTLIPFVDSVVTQDGVTFFRTPTSHYSLPIAYTVLMLFLAHILAFVTHPIKHIGNFIKIQVFFQLKSIKELPMAILDFLLGLLDIIGELAKLISLSTRLFGNMFAGSVIVAIIGGLSTFTQFIVPMPFIVLGIISGLVQAFVFVMLSTIFISSTLAGVDTPVAENDKIELSTI